eukprot:1146419-Pelagomonas_calceolata.AAC.9
MPYFLSQYLLLAVQGPVLLRAAAICNILDECSPKDECKVDSLGLGTEDEAMDFWWVASVMHELLSTKSFQNFPKHVTHVLSFCFFSVFDAPDPLLPATDGTVAGSMVGNKTVSPDSASHCFSDSDCIEDPVAQFCDKSEAETVQKFFCNDNGFEQPRVQELLDSHACLSRD